MPQGWTVNPTTDQITFNEAPPTGTNNILVREYPAATKNVSDIWALGAWSAEFGYPAEVEFFADRLVFANTETQPQTLWFSQVGNYSSFARSRPLEDSDTISATINARQVNAVQDLVPLDKMILLTTGGEWKTTGGQDDVLTPTSIAFKPQSYRGATDIPALVIGSNALFVQGRGAIVRDIGYTFETDNYTGNDLTVFSSHLFEGQTIREWAYQQHPYSIVWVVREDGVLLALTYMREQEVIGWTPQETDGFVESVCVVPEDDEDAVYIVVRREIDGEQKRYVERLSSRIFDDVRDCTFMDSFLSYRGLYTATPAVTLRCNAIGAGGYTSDDDVSIVADFGASPVFSVDDVGDEIWLYDADGTVLRLTVLERTTAAAVVCRPLRDVPASLQAGGGTSTWAFARRTMSGLDHLEGREVAILADGFVHQRLTVTSGSVTLDEPHAVVHIGLPYTADFETLEVNTPGGESTRMRFKAIKKVGLILQDSRGIQVGQDFDHLDEWEPRQAEDYENPPDLQQDLVEMNISYSWSSAGRVCVRQADPLPLSILGVIPEVEFGT